MTHSDDQGLVLPPTVAPTQVVIVPIWQEDTKDDVLEYSENIADDLEEAGFRVELDDRDERNPGFKFNEHEQRDPAASGDRPHEVDDGEATLVHRPDNEQSVAERDEIVDAVDEHLDEIYDKLYETAEENLEENVRDAHSPRRRSSGRSANTAAT